MKHIQLIILILCLNSLSHCSQNTPQSSPTATTSWWERSKNYATSWVPQSIQYQARSLSRSINDNLNPMRRYRLDRETKLIAQDLLELVDNKIKNPSIDINPEINNIMKLVSESARDNDFDPNKIINNAINLTYNIMTIRKVNIEDRAIKQFLIQDRKNKIAGVDKAIKKKLIESFRKTIAELDVPFKILSEIEKIIRATDLTEISHYQ